MQYNLHISYLASSLAFILRAIPTLNPNEVCSESRFELQNQKIVSLLNKANSLLLPRHLSPPTAILFFFFVKPSHGYSILGFSPTPRKLGGLTVTRENLAQDFLEDFGARDPYPEKIASQFGDKVLEEPKH